MSLALTIASMTAAGCSAEQINAVVQAHEAEREKEAAERRATKWKDCTYGLPPKEWYALRWRIFDRDGYRCVYCGSDGDGKAFHCDHVMPWSRGGKSTPDNLVTACYSCNTSKCDKTPEEWRR